MDLLDAAIALAVFLAATVSTVSVVTGLFVHPPRPDSRVPVKLHREIFKGCFDRRFSGHFYEVVKLTDFLTAEVMKYALRFQFNTGAINSI